MVVFFSSTGNTLPHQIHFQKPSPAPSSEGQVRDRVRGALVGLAVSDALGASVEFRPRQYLVANPVRKMEGGGTWGLDAGKWTDDTSMALCLAASLIHEEGFNSYDQMVRYKWWFTKGYLSSTGNCFDIGKATRQSLVEFSKRQRILKASYRCRNESELDRLAWESIEDVSSFDVECGAEEAAGNGALMRLVPIPLFYFQKPALAVKYAGRSTSLTHANRKAIDASRYYAALIVEALHGKTKDELLAENFLSKHKTWFSERPLDADIQAVAEGSFKRTNGYEDGIRGKGYVVNALEAALWAFWADEGSFEKGALLAVNLGDDTDTTAAIYGQLAGAYYGYEKIPDDWKRKLYAQDFILCIAEWLHCLGTRHPLETNLDKEDRSENNDQFQSNSTASLKKQTSLIEPSSSKPPLNRSISTDSNPNTAATRTGSSRPRLHGTPSGNSFDRDSFQGSQDEYRFYPNKD